MSRVVDGSLVQCTKVPKPPKAAPKEINKRSVKNRASEADLAKNRKIILARHPICQRCGIRPSNVVHHVLRRSQGGGNELHNLLALCEGPFYDRAGVVQGCHETVHASPETSFKEGWLRRPHPREGDAHWADPDLWVRS